jgi:endonuclease/exonuclease/phosphatase family metal-dependent hydrolase
MPPEPDRTTGLTVATFNVAGLPGRLPPLRERAAAIGCALDEAPVDIVNLQEVWTYGQLSVLRRRLTGYPHVAWRRGVAGPAGGLVTFSRQPPGPTRFTSFRAAHTTTGGLRFRAVKKVNSFLQGLLTVAFPKVPVTVGNTHLTANRDGDWSPGARHETLHRGQLEIVHRVARAAGVTVLTGDFNVPSRSALYPWVIDGGGWHDPFTDVDLVTFQPAFLPPDRRSSRIDYVLVPAGVTALATGTLFADPVDGRYLSDHVGLWARVPINAPVR